MDIALELLAVFAIIAGNAYFVIAEYAIVTARRSALETRAAQGSGGAATALRLMDDPVRVISAVQIAITALGILLGAVGEPVIRALIGEAVPTWAAIVLGFLTITYLSVAFGELVPKALALATAEKVAIFVARPIDLFARACTPAVWALQLGAQAVLKPLGVPAVTAGERPISREELRGVLQEAEEHGALRADEEDMLTGVIDLRVRQVQDVMRPWDDVTAVRVEDEASVSLDRMLRSAHTRFPVVERELEIRGVLHARDAWTAWRDADGRDDAVEIEPLVRDAVIVPPTVRVDALLRRLRRERQQLAVVIDEYGRPVGIATLEDILEEIVGEIEDEFDQLDHRFEDTGDSGWLVDAAVSLSDVNRRVGTRLDAARARSLGGLMLEQLGRLPDDGERLDVDGMTLVAEELDGHRIELVRILADPDTADGSGGAMKVVDPA